MQKLTKEKILKDFYVRRKMAVYCIFFILGIFVTFSPLLYFRKIHFNSVFGTVFCFLIFGIGIGYFCGLRHIIKTVGIRKKIIQDKYRIIEDVVIDKELTNGSGVEDDSDDYCMLTFRDYSNRTDKCIRITAETYRRTKIGDKYYLIYVDGIEEPIEIYPAKEYIC